MKRVLGEMGERGPAPLMDMNMMVVLAGRDIPRGERKSGSQRTCMGLFLSRGFSCQGAFPPWLGSRSADCSLGFAHSSLFGAGKAVLHPVAWDQAAGARGRGQGTETLA
jgi:hypothetical protein